MKKAFILLSSFTAVLMVMIATTDSLAYDAYSITTTSGNCANCHGDFRGANYISNKDGTAWSTSLHDGHRNIILSGDCNVCHAASGRFPVILDSSAGGRGFEPISCVGCHGHNEDIGGDGLSAGRGRGLRQHHQNAGVTLCAGCHSDSAGPSGVGENVPPSYYFTPDPEHPNKPTDPCNTNGSESIFGNVGLDNDGDLLDDGSDPDCQASECGNGVIESGEECDDGNTLDGDCCSANCVFEMAGSPCLDGQYCNGEETCDGAGACQAGPPVDCNDGIACTDDICDETNDVCLNTPNDASCPDDGLFCNGEEFCDGQNDCSSTGDPCSTGTVCNEATDTCDAVAACGNGILETGEQCDDGNIMDGDCCSANCQYEVAGSSCADNQFCNGEETCDGAGTCDDGMPVNCNDAVACTVDSCDEVADVCVNTPDDFVCNDGKFCNGIEVCDPVNDCQEGTPVDCSDGVACTDDTCDEVNDVCSSTPNDTNCPDDGLFCNGEEFCDGQNDCSSTGDPCPTGTVCNEATATCDAVTACGNGIVEFGEECDDGNTADGDCCSANCLYEVAGSPCPDGEFCNGEEICNGQGACQAGMPVDCDDGVGCTIDSCDEANDSCVNTPNDNNCPDDGFFCNGQEVCDTVNGCVSTGDPCPSGTTCNEGMDTCDPVAGKVTICHIPPGNHDKARTLSIDAMSVDDHLAHGDTLGPCMN